jgi:hypothetical protein
MGKDNFPKSIRNLEDSVIVQYVMNGFITSFNHSLLNAYGFKSNPLDVACRYNYNMVNLTSNLYWNTDQIELLWQFKKEMRDKKFSPYRIENMLKDIRIN